jgi:uncharacterized SAM-binding protein YcdF (DUF218 family)
VVLGFWVKRVLGQMLMPLGVSLLLSLWGMILSLLGRPRRAVAPFVLAAVLLYAVSIDPVAMRVVQPLERAFPPMGSGLSVQQRGVRWVVVLGSGHHADESLPPLARLDTVAVARLAEAVRLMAAIPQARLLVTGGSPSGKAPHAQVLAQAAAQLGVDPGRIVQEPDSVDTPEQVLRIARLVHDQPFFLVTSATHMPRAVLLCRAQGLAPIPAPTAFETFSPEGLPFVPYSRNIQACHRAMHEYLGIGWAWLTGRLGWGR